MISSDRISIITPTTPGDILSIAGDITTVARAFPSNGWNQEDEDFSEFIEWLTTAPHVLTMVYVDGLPAAWIRIDDHQDNPGEVGRKCLEFSGAILPEYQGQGLTETVAPIAIDAAFARSKAKKMIAVTDGDNPAAAAALAALGFNYRDTDARGRRIYRLTRAQVYA